MGRNDRRISFNKQADTKVIGDITIKMAIPPYDDKLRLESGNVIEGAVKES